MCGLFQVLKETFYNTLSMCFFRVVFSLLLFVVLMFVLYSILKFPAVTLSPSPESKTV
jgi:hypothetical protein